MSRVANNWTYEGEMAEREDRRSQGEERLCAIIANPDYAGRICPADGVSQCDDCPFREEPTP